MRQCIHALGAFFVAFIIFAMFFSKRDPSDIELGPRTVASVHQARVTSGQWVLFLASDQSRQEAFVKCRRDVKAGETIVLENVTQGYRYIRYSARCI